MVTKQKVRVVYRLNTQKEKNGKHPVFMRIFVDNTVRLQTKVDFFLWTIL